MAPIMQLWHSLFQYYRHWSIKDNKDNFTQRWNDNSLYKFDIWVQLWKIAMADFLRNSEFPGGDCPRQAPPPGYMPRINTVPGVGRGRICMTSFDSPTPKTPYYTQDHGRYLLRKPSFSWFCLKFRCSGNRGSSGVNLNDEVKLTDPENHT